MHPEKIASGHIFGFKFVKVCEDLAPVLRKQQRNRTRDADWPRSSVPRASLVRFISWKRKKKRPGPTGNNTGSALATAAVQLFILRLKICSGPSRMEGRNGHGGMSVSLTIYGN